MKTTIFLILLFFISISYPQKNDTWFVFINEETGLYGFRDSTGNIKIEPVFSGFLQAKKFSDIIAVNDNNNENYYLLKNGEKTGRDSLYIFDSGFDCESEGFIRFQDPKTSMTGILNSSGKVVVPAEYDALSKIINGYAAALKDAQKEYWDNEDAASDHWSWKGGTEYLIDNNNNIIVKGFVYNPELDFRSLKIEDTASNDPSRESFLSTDGKYYSFINNEKLFSGWFLDIFLKKLSKNEIIENSYPEIIYWTEESGWVSRKCSDFINSNYELIKERISAAAVENADFFISPEDFIIYPENLTAEFEKYLDNCGNLKSTQYPIMNVVINHKTGNNSFQDNFSFLKTENGFKLLNVSVLDCSLK